MKPALAALVAFTFLAPTPSSAEEIRGFDAASIAATLLEGSKACDLPIQSDRMMAWFDAKVSPDQAGKFAAHLGSFLRNKKRDIKGMDKDQRDLFCHAVQVKASDAGWLSN